MPQNQSDKHSVNNENPVNGFLNGIAYLMAKRWLKDQRSSVEETPKREVTFTSNDQIGVKMISRSNFSRERIE